MFKEIIDHARPVKNSHNSVMLIVDTDFEDEFEWNPNDNIRSFWNGVIGVYERQGARVAPNVVLALKERLGRSGNEYRGEAYEPSEKFAQYREEIEQLMVLV